MREALDYNVRPFLAIWESTRACDLACVHCRAHAIPEPDPQELSTAEAKKLLDAVAGLGSPVFIFSGGDPLKRPDIFELVSYGKSLGIRCGLIPAVTPNLDKKQLENLKNAGLDQVAFSLDAPTAEAHDAFRKVDGIFKRTLEAVWWAFELGLRIQINSLINHHNIKDLDSFIELIQSLPIVFWEVFFLVPTGRGQDLSVLSPDDFERVFEKLYALNKKADFLLKITEAPHYRRYFIGRESGYLKSSISPQMPAALRRVEGPGGSIGLAPRGVNAGKGFVFISKTGQIMPSGFLPIEAGNIRTHDLAEVYRLHPLFVALRDPSKLKGRCGACEFADICGGSRARAWAMKDDYLEEDPCCGYIPAASRATP